MRSHLRVSACLLAFVCGVCPTFAQSYRLDIALEGPWILYEDKHFRISSGDNSKEVPVLVAIAPSGATAHPLIGNDVLHHHIPQMSTGEGYFIEKPGVYCLKFNDTCAPYGASSLTNDHGYPQEHLLKMTPDTTPWPWPQKSSGNVALILPMPDFYSNDGAWPMRFRSEYTLDYKTKRDEMSSIGLILHYDKGGSRLSLFVCDLTKPAADNCITPAKDRSGNNIGAANTGALRLQMRAPDNDNICDHHVRRGYHEMFKMLSSRYNQGYSYIEPAKGLNPDGSGQFEDQNIHPCFTADQVNNDQGTFQIQGGLQDHPPTPTSTEKTCTAMDLIMDLSCLHSRLEQIVETDPKFHSPLKPALDQIKAALDEARNLGDFPKISAVRQIGALLEDSISSINNFSADKAADVGADILRKLADIVRDLQLLANDTKNGADCRAPVVLMQ